MLDLLNTIVQYIITGIQHVLVLIRNIPVYIGHVRTLTTSFIPDFMQPFLVVGLIALVVIHIKRVVLS